MAEWGKSQPMHNVDIQVGNKWDWIKIKQKTLELERCNIDLELIEMVLFNKEKALNQRVSTN